MADNPRDRKRPIHTAMAAPMNPRAGVSTLEHDGLRINEQTATIGSVPGTGFSARQHGQRAPDEPAGGNARSQEQRK